MQNGAFWWLNGTKVGRPGQGRPDARQTMVRAERCSTWSSSGATAAERKARMQVTDPWRPMTVERPEERAMWLSDLTTPHARDWLRHAPYRRVNDCPWLGHRQLHQAATVDNGRVPHEPGPPVGGANTLAKLRR